MKTKNEICVPIRYEKELQKAREILERNGGKISASNFNFEYMKRHKAWYYLKFMDGYGWYIGGKYHLTEIPLSELESVLRGESEGENAYYSFFKFMSDEHNLTLTDTEMSDIINEAKKVIEKLKND